MNYDDIKSAALQYADKDKASHVIDNIDWFLRVVESRISRTLKISKMTARATLPLLQDQEYYGLPDDFAGVRDVEIRTDLTSRDRTTLRYLSPEQMNTQAANSGVTLSYTIIANQIQIFPPQADKLLEIVYYQRIPELKSAAPVNWLSNYNPDAYIFGLLVEISSFLKDDNATQMWESRFQGSISGITHDDAITRWSGTALTIKAG